jgi:hypothetical protein
VNTWLPVDDQIAPGESRYARLAVWLQRVPANQESCSLTFNQIEEFSEPSYLHRRAPIAAGGQTTA